jgi:hypothetical protein
VDSGQGDERDASERARGQSAKPVHVRFSLTSCGDFRHRVAPDREKRRLAHFDRNVRDITREERDNPTGKSRQHAKMT